MQPAPLPRATDGQFLRLDELPQSVVYDPVSNTSYVEVVQDGIAYRQTMTYSGTRLTNIGKWVKQ